MHTGPATAPASFHEMTCFSCHHYRTTAGDFCNFFFSPTITNSNIDDANQASDQHLHPVPIMQITLAQTVRKLRTRFRGVSGAHSSFGCQWMSSVCRLPALLPANSIYSSSAILATRDRAEAAKNPRSERRAGRKVVLHKDIWIQRLAPPCLTATTGSIV